MSSKFRIETLDKIFCLSFILKFPGLDASFKDSFAVLILKNEDGFPFHGVLSSTTYSSILGDDITLVFFLLPFLPAFFGFASFV